MGNTGATLLALALIRLALGCDTPAVGDPCTPEPEQHAAFSGFHEREVYVESGSFECETRVCLVHHFRGRVSCPYGQSAGAVSSLPAHHPERCRLPGMDGSDDSEAVSVFVPAQVYSRTAVASPPRTGIGKQRRAVYCSCRCANAAGVTNDGARYCDCPSGFSCQPLLEDVGIGRAELAGAYCVADDGAYPEISGEDCSSGARNCGNDGKNP